MLIKIAAICCNLHLLRERHRRPLGQQPPTSSELRVTIQVWRLLWESQPNVAGQTVHWCFADATYRVNGGVAFDRLAQIDRCQCNLRPEIHGRLPE